MAIRHTVLHSLFTDDLTTDSQVGCTRFVESVRKEEDYDPVRV